MAGDVAIVGIGATDYFRRGESWPRTIVQLAGEAILSACSDAGLDPRLLDGFSYYAGGNAGASGLFDSAELMETLGIDDLRFTAAITGGGGGSAGAIGLARSAIVSGEAEYVVTVMALQQKAQRLGQMMLATESPLSSFLAPAGVYGPGQAMAMMARRHMHDFGTRREAFAEVAMSQRNNALNRPKARMRSELTSADYFGARMVADPLCLFDFCLESDGAVAVITTSMERARDLRQVPVPVRAAVHGGPRSWGRGFQWLGMDDDSFASSGYQQLAGRLYQRAGVSANDMDVALLYDHFTPMVVMQLEDFGFCARGEGGAFVESGAIRYPKGEIPVNTHGGHLSEAYLIGMTHLVEAVEQLRGTAINQVEGAELALVSGGTAPAPMSALILGGA